MGDAWRTATQAANIRIYPDCSRALGPDLRLCVDRRSPKCSRSPDPHCRGGDVGRLYAPPARKRADSTSGCGIDLFWSAIFYLPIYVGFSLSNLRYASGRELLFQSLYQGFMMSVVAIFAFNCAIASLGFRAAAAIVALVPATAAVLAIPVLGEVPSLPSARAVCVIAIGVMLAASSPQSKASLKATGESA